VFFEVTLPLIRPGVIAGGIFAFIVSFDQFPISLFLVVPGGETLPVVLFNYIRFDLDGAIAAASMVSIVLALSAVLLLERIIGLRAYVQTVNKERETDMATNGKSRGAVSEEREWCGGCRQRSARRRSCTHRPRC
jgi:ABC-type Fe3+ transport system permease subunit